MILVCPECSTHYEIPTALPEEGSKVRCTSCTHVWIATADDVFETADLANEAALADESAAAEVEAEAEEFGSDMTADDGGIPAISPTDEDPLEELDFEEIEDEEIDGSEELDQSALDSLFDEMEPEPEPEPEEDNSQGDIDSLFDEMGDDEPEEENSQGDVDSLFDEMGEDEGEDNSQDDIDGLFDEEPGDDNSQDDIDGLFDEEPAKEEPPVEEPPVEEPLAAAEPEVETPVANEESEALPASEAEPVAGQLPIWKRLSRNEMIGWGSYGLSVLLVFAIVIMARVSIVRAIPSMAGVYAAFGMDVNVRGLTFRNVQHKWVFEDTRLLLKIQGEVTNLTSKYKTLPPMVFAAVGSNKKDIFRWVMRVRKKPLLPGEKASFTASIPLPPKQAKNLYISFQ